MPIVIAEAIAPIASWRPPEALTYHRTLPLPPYTSLVGVVGAAVGLGLEEAYQYISDRGIHLGVGGWAEGRVRDLWKYQKLESIAEGKEITSDVLLREHWIDARLVFVIECPDDSIAQELAVAMERPAFPITAGTSDALLKVVAVRVDQGPIQSVRRLAYSLVYDELQPAYRFAEDLDAIPLNRTIRAPTVERLPTGFVFETDAPRRLAGRALVTFVADPIELADDIPPVTGYAVIPASSVLSKSATYRILKEQSPWIIPVDRYIFPLPEKMGSSTKPSPKGPTIKVKKGNPTGDT